jgi:hypothetical protein
MTQLSRRIASFANSITGYSYNFILNTEHHLYSGREYTIFTLEANERRIKVRIEQKFSLVTYAKVKREIQLLQAIIKERIYHLPRLINYDLELMPSLITIS